MKIIAIALTISSILFVAAVSPVSAGKMNGKPGCGRPGCSLAQYELNPNSAHKPKP
jgi:hypothetical protein